MNKWWKLNYVLLHVNKFCVKLWKIDWNIAFTWLKHNVKPVGLYESTSKLRFHSGFMIYFLFTTLFKLVASMSKVASAVGAYLNPCLRFHLSSSVSLSPLSTPPYFNSSFIHSHTPIPLARVLGSEIVGSAQLRKREHENKTETAPPPPLVQDHVVQLYIFACLLLFSRPSHLGVIPTICRVRAKSWFFEKSLQICKVLKINRDKAVWKNVARVFIRLSLLLLAKTFLVARSKEKRLYSQARKNGKKSRVFLFFQSYNKCLISDFFPIVKSHSSRL